VIMYYEISQALIARQGRGAGCVQRVQRGSGWESELTMVASDPVRTQPGSHVHS
jgi:hypothetical protein